MKLKLLTGEIEVAIAKNVTLHHLSLKTSKDSDETSISGQLIVTNFRLSFLSVCNVNIIIIIIVTVYENIHHNEPFVFL